ncbi:MAG TPA: hypothetical protein VFA23_00325 [Dongiaceae bacterium]|nr:hypothetical protein [Dongiaceae bacterium]
MIYVEFIERDRFMPIEIFRRLGDQSSWTAAEDQLVGSFGRTMRLGPIPGYLAFWRCKGMARMDEWEAHFRTPEAQRDIAEQATHRAIHLQHAGCYDELAGETAVDRGMLFCIEYFAAPSRTSDEEVLRHYRARAARQPAARLSFLLRRIGRLGPDPGALAVWSLADYVALEAFERAREDDDPLRPAAVGVYRWFGREIL